MTLHRHIAMNTRRRLTTNRNQRRRRRHQLKRIRIHSRHISRPRTVTQMSRSLNITTTNTQFTKNNTNLRHTSSNNPSHSRSATTNTHNDSPIRRALISLSPLTVRLISHQVISPRQLRNTHTSIRHSRNTTRTRHVRPFRRQHIRIRPHNQYHSNTKLINMRNLMTLTINHHINAISMKQRQRISRPYRRLLRQLIHLRNSPPRSILTNTSPGTNTINRISIPTNLKHLQHTRLRRHLIHTRRTLSRSLSLTTQVLTTRRPHQSRTNIIRRRRITQHRRLQRIPRSTILGYTATNINSRRTTHTTLNRQLLHSRFKQRFMTRVKGLRPTVMKTTPQ